MPYVRKNIQMFCTKYMLARVRYPNRLPTVTITLAPCFLSINIPRYGSSGKLAGLKMGISENWVRVIFNSSPVEMIKTPNA